MTQSEIPAPYTMTVETPEVFPIEWGGLPMLVLNIFFFNLLVSAFCQITLTGLIFFLFSAAVLVWRAWFWGSLLSQLPTSPFLAVLPTLIFEGEAYVLASVIGVVLGLSWLKPGLVFSDEHLSSARAKLVLRSDECHPNCKTSIHIQIENATGGWNQVASYIPRMYMSTDIIDLSAHLPDANGKLRVRAYFTFQHKLDYVGLDTTKQGECETRYATMVSATHSNTTDVKTTLANSDNIYVELWPSEHVILEFALPETTQETRDYIIILEGHYFFIE